MIKELNFRNGAQSKTLRYVAIQDIVSLSLDKLTSCFFLVDTVCEWANFKKIAAAIFAIGCREFSFAGAASHRWECDFDLYDCDRDAPEDDWATTSHYENISEFLKMLNIAISASECLLIYDTPVSLLALQYQLLDLWEIDS